MDVVRQADGVTVRIANHLDAEGGKPIGSGDAVHRKVFFFQAEDGIRDYKVTGVQTCALPISVQVLRPAADLSPDSGAGELVVERADGLVDCALALAAAILQKAGDALVELGLEVADRKSVV